MTIVLTRPIDIEVDRNIGQLKITWQDNVTHRYPLDWLRAHCPCATCMEERREAAANVNELRLHTGPLPSTEIAGAELVGNYAIRLDWSDGHSTGIYPFIDLRSAAESSKQATTEAENGDLVDPFSEPRS